MKQPLQALIIDEESSTVDFIAAILAAGGWTVSIARSAGQAFEKMLEQRWALVFCDVVFGDIDGYEILRRFSEKQAQARFVLMTDHGSAAGALDAIAFGAYDYLVKPLTDAHIRRIAEIVREHRQFYLPEKTPDTPQDYKSNVSLIGKSPKFIDCLKTVGRIAATNLPVLITGESGTGKEVVAQSIHRRSSRASGAFVAVNCGAIPVELIESELFGHAKGAFTGADRERVGLWEEADGGTILLDEITETSPLFQVKLLRALQQGEIRRVGSNRTLKIDVRVIAATNRDVEEEVRQGRFRQDLMYRLNAVMIDLPPLRERVEDILPLAEHFARQINVTKAAVSFSPAAIEILKNYSWHGNVRELENAVCHAVSLSEDVIYPQHLPKKLLQIDKSLPDLQQTIETAVGYNDKWLSLAEMETRYVNQVLTYANGNKQAAARLLNIDRKTLTRVIKRSESGV